MNREELIEQIQEYRGNFVMDMNRMARAININAHSKGFWEDGSTDEQKMLLMHAEISEAVEAHRKGNPPSEKTPNHSSMAEEFADLVIRVMDFCHERNIPLAQAIADKALYNLDRPHKHGKAY